MLTRNKWRDIWLWPAIICLVVFAIFTLGMPKKEEDQAGEPAQEPSSEAEGTAQESAEAEGTAHESAEPAAPAKQPVTPPPLPPKGPEATDTPFNSP